ncbi:hypothetical protein OROMI_010198 [Orobanche minor]
MDVQASCWQRFCGDPNEELCTDEPEDSGVGYGGAVDHLGILAVRGAPLVVVGGETDVRNYLLRRLELLKAWLR